MRRRSIFGAATVAAALILTGASQGAYAQKTDDVPATPGATLPVEGIPGDLALAVDKLEDSPLFSQINDLSWDDNTQMLHVHLLQSTNGLSAALRAFLPAGSFDFVKDPLDHRALVAQEATVVKVAERVGLRVATVFPEADNSGLWVRVVDPSQPPGSAVRESSATGAVTAAISAPIR